MKTLYSELVKFCVDNNVDDKESVYLLGLLNKYHITLNHSSDEEDDIKSKEQLSCIHDITQLRLVGSNILCLDCKTTWRDVKAK